MRLVNASLLIPFTVQASHRTLSTNQFDLSPVENPLGCSSFYPLKNLGSEQGLQRSSVHNQPAAITLCATDDPVLWDRQGRSGITLEIHQPDPKPMNNPIRRECYVWKTLHMLRTNLFSVSVARGTGFRPRCGSRRAL